MPSWLATTTERAADLRAVRGTNAPRIREPAEDEGFAPRLELWQYALQNDTIRASFAEREALARTALARDITHEFEALGLSPPAPVELLALIVHALEDGLLIQRAITPDAALPEIEVDAGELLMRSWLALASMRPVEHAPAAPGPPLA